MTKENGNTCWPPATRHFPHKGGQMTARGFTLIELLVVVLIIDILAAIAVPQYQLAVAKSRFTQVQTGGDAFIKAYKIYYLANGEDPTTLDDLDFLPFNGTVNDTKKSISNADTTCSILNSYFQFYCVISGVPDWVYYFPTHTTVSVRDIRVCRAHSDFEKKVCISAGGTFKSTGPNDQYTDYYLP